MHIRRIVVALSLGLSLAAGIARADTSAGGNGDKKKPASGAKAKRGDACKATTDCDQALGPTSCVSNKCQADIIHPPVT